MCNRKNINNKHQITLTLTIKTLTITIIALRMVGIKVVLKNKSFNLLFQFKWSHYIKVINKFNTKYITDLL